MKSFKCDRNFSNKNIDVWKDSIPFLWFNLNFCVEKSAQMLAKPEPKTSNLSVSSDIADRSWRFRLEKFILILKVVFTTRNMIGNRIDREIRRIEWVVYGRWVYWEHTVEDIHFSMELDCLKRCKSIIMLKEINESIWINIALILSKRYLEKRRFFDVSTVKSHEGPEIQK